MFGRHVHGWKSRAQIVFSPERERRPGKQISRVKGQSENQASPTTSGLWEQAGTSFHADALR